MTLPDDHEPLDPEALREEASHARDYARVIRLWHDAFIEAGFSASDALALTQQRMADHSAK